MIIWWPRTAVAVFVGPETTLTLTLTSGSHGQYGTLEYSGMERRCLL